VERATVISDVLAVMSPVRVCGAISILYQYQPHTHIIDITQAMDLYILALGASI